MDYSPPGSSVHGISLARILECVAIPYSRGSSRSRDHGTQISCIADFFFLLFKSQGKPKYTYTPKKFKKIINKIKDEIAIKC